MTLVIDFLTVLMSALYSDRVYVSTERASVSEALQEILLRERWKALIPSRYHYQAHCSSVGEPRPSRRVPDAGTAVPAE